MTEAELILHLPGAWQVAQCLFTSPPSLNMDVGRFSKMEDSKYSLTKWALLGQVCSYSDVAVPGPPVLSGLAAEGVDIHFSSALLALSPHLCLSGVCLMSSLLVQAHLRQVQFRKMHLRQEQLRQIQHNQVHLRQVQHRQVQHRQVQHRQVQFSQVHLRQVQLTQVQHRQVHLTQVQHREVQLRQVQFSAAK